MFHEHRFTLTAQHSTLRLDQALSDLTGMSRRKTRKIIDLGGVYVNSKRCRKAGKLCRKDAILRLYCLDEESIRPFQAEQIIWQSSDLILIHKRPKQHAQAALHRILGTIPYEISKMPGQSDHQDILPVHRLDYGTSGLMLLAKNKKTCLHLQQHWHTGVEKSYLAIVSDPVDWDETTVKEAIGKQRNTQGCYEIDTAGRMAETRFRIIERIGQHTLLEAKPVTWRAHQVRVHLKHLGLPILGDTRYGGKKSHRLMLHAHTLHVHPPALPSMHQWSIKPEEDWQWPITLD